MKIYEPSIILIFVWQIILVCQIFFFVSKSSLGFRLRNKSGTIYGFVAIIKHQGRRERDSCRKLFRHPRFECSFRLKFNLQGAERTLLNRVGKNKYCISPRGKCNKIAIFYYLFTQNGSFGRGVAATSSKYYANVKRCWRTR